MTTPYLHSVASSEGSVAHDGVSEEEERAQPYTVLVGQMESIFFPEKKKELKFRLYPACYFVAGDSLRSTTPS